MTAKEVKKASENLACPVCFKIFKNPKYLPCYHSYCEECLEAMSAHAQSQSKITCPECRKEVTIPEGGVKNLPNNFLVNRLVDELVFKCKIDGDENVKCDNCTEDDPVVTYCLECSIFLCHVCNQAHKRDRRSMSHMSDIISLAELTVAKDVPVQTKQKNLMCEKHNLELQFYCESCEELLCVYCTTKEHNGHNHDSVKEVVAKHREELREITAPVEKLIQDLSNVHDTLSKMSKEIKKVGNEVEQQIDNYYDEVNQQLMEQKNKIKEQLHYTVSQKEKAIAAQIDEVDCMQVEVSAIKELKIATVKSSDQEFLSAKKQIKCRVNEVTDKYKMLNNHPEQSATMEFIPYEQIFPKFGQLFTHVEPTASKVTKLSQHGFVGQPIVFTINTKYHNGPRCAKGGSQLFVEGGHNRQDRMDLDAQVRDNNDGSYTASFVAQKVGTLYLSVSCNGLAIRERPYEIVIHGSYLAVDKPNIIIDNNGSMGHPVGIAFSKCGMWAVSDWSKDCIYIYDKQNENIIKFGSRGSSNGRFQHPYGIAFDTEDHLYVADSCNHRVQKFEATGKYLLQFGVSGSDNGHLNTPRSVVIQNDKVYVADCNNQRISVFQSNGRFCYTFGEGPLVAPYDVAIDTNNLLYVADHTGHCIRTFTLDGQYISQYFNGEGEPCSLATDSSNSILVADTGNHRIAFLDKDGNCKHCIGSKGCRHGQFDFPRGIAISPSGSIYVSDSVNKRIQIFSMF